MSTPEKELKKLQKEFFKHVQFVRDYLNLLDHTMKQPESVERGRRIADLSNKLEMKNDMVRRFTLGVDMRGRPVKRAPDSYFETKRARLTDR